MLSNSYGPAIPTAEQNVRAELRKETVTLNKLVAAKGAAALREVSDWLRELHATLPDGESQKGHNTAMRHKVEALVRELEKAISVGRPTLSETLFRVATSPRVNLGEPGVADLLRKGLVEKDWERNDASGEAVRLTAAGKERIRAENC